jgi:outer membrane protein TolC
MSPALFVKRSKFFLLVICFINLLQPISGFAGVFPEATSSTSANQIAADEVLSLPACLDLALKQSHRRPASQYAVLVAEAQHRQALAAYWPQIGAKAGYQRMDESPDFLFPASTYSIAAQPLPLPPGYGLAIADPGNNIVGTLSSIPAQSVTVPAQDVKLMDPESFSASLNLTWLLFDGGMRHGYRQQAEGYVALMKAEAHRTDLEIADSVRRMYYGAVLARQLHQLGQNTLARMEATLHLTETMYKEGSGKVTKADFLENKVMVETLRSMVALLEKNEALARAALANTMGLAWAESITPQDQTIPFTPVAGNLSELVTTAYQFNPDWEKIAAGLQAAEGAVETAQSGHYPKVALTGELHKWWNDYNAGTATDRNKEGWTVGVGMEIPLFDGFLTRNKIAEARAQLAKIKEEKILLQEGIGLQVKSAFLGLTATQKAYQATLDAMTAATENRDLNTRAYENELVETEKVVRAQLTEALMSAQHYKVCYDQAALQSQLNLIVGTEVLKQFQVP